ncbi:hypothetical protein CYMTET_46001 [Cymbomonas tetramitiformis]|uniref:Rho-GAP domain-containing protein n=1 Tax=Cymbomonas tetramitiformis TaxID=36881 RepID=A0AAE0BX09_9CHLO|nr:hypothetical protein CYMTET_51650 [Cymbomonas tetramitiformis]KAK3244381.1 hypothetical protein CYMTET_46001 [Cymbomonas tetramitiformis]
MSGVDTAVRVVQDTVTWLQANALGIEGLFRARGDMSQIHAIKQKYDRGIPGALQGCKDPFVVAGVLKLHLATLPEPLLSFRLYDSFLSVASTHNRSRRIQQLQHLIHCLPPPALRIVELVIPLLAQICATNKSPTNTPQRLAVLFSPILLRLRNADVYKVVEDVKRADAVTEELIREYETVLLFEPEISANVPEPNKQENTNTSGTAQPDLTKASGATQNRIPMDPLVDTTLDGATDMLFSEAPGVFVEVDRALGGALGHIFNGSVKKMTADDLHAEKVVVKRKLRNFDNYFYERHGRKASREDKEHLRPLYLRYYKLRCFLEGGRDKKEWKNGK